eukprot:3309660-Pyramimonas_sp.AAC.1
MNDRVQPYSPLRNGPFAAEEDEKAAGWNYRRAGGISPKLVAILHQLLIRQHLRVTRDSGGTVRATMWTIKAAVWTIRAPSGRRGLA